MSDFKEIGTQRIQQLEKSYKDNSQAYFNSYGKEMCEKHGNEYCDWKCMYCCSIALFYCAGGRMKFCTPCHNDAMNGGAKVKTQCTGGENCPLGLKKHPKADGDRNKSSFPLGCSLCRSEKLALIAQNKNATAGINLE